MQRLRSAIRGRSRCMGWWGRNAGRKPRQWTAACEGRSRNYASAFQLKRTGARRSSGTGGIQEDRVPGARNVEPVLAYNKAERITRLAGLRGQYQGANVNSTLKNAGKLKARPNAALRPDCHKSFCAPCRSSGRMACLLQVLGTMIPAILTGGMS